VRKRKIDWYVLIPVLLMMCVGIIMVLSASSPTTVLGKDHDTYIFFRKQLIWLGFGLVAMFFTANYNYRKWRKFVIPAAVLTVVLLLAVFGFKAKNGAHSWIPIGDNQFQPSEFVKLCVILIMSQMMSSKKARMESFRDGLFPILIVVAVVCGLVVLEPDLGTATVIAITSFVMLFVGGARYLHLSAMAGVGTGMAILAVYVAPYRMVRILAFWDPAKDPGGSGWQINQSLYAIGSGGLLGVGLGHSMQKFRYIPEQHTDFIFSILAEELGFLGAGFIIVLLIFFAARGYRIAKNSRDTFGSLMACGITTMILVEAMINIAVVTGSMPVTGITLPFISYGGSSLIFKMSAIGVLLNISRYISSEEILSVGNTGSPRKSGIFGT